MAGGVWLLLLLLCQTGWSHMIARCPSGWESRGGSDMCYLLHSYGHDRTFQFARTYCQDRGGDIAHIQSLEMKEYYGQLIAATGDVGENALYWVGAHKKDGKWVWIDNGNAIDETIITWEGTGTGSCGALTVNSKLLKMDCKTELKFICKRSITTPPACDYDAGWEQQNGKCFKGSTEKDSWHDAAVLCDIEGGSVATLTNDKESQLAHDYALMHHDNVWIGFTEEGHPGTYKWVDGSKSNYTNWEEGQPDGSVNGIGAALVSKDDLDGKWVAEKVTDEFHYMCKKKTGSCFYGWETFQQSCYYFNTEGEDSVVWEDAKDICEAAGATLVVLDTPAEDAFFRNHMPEGDKLWIGLYSDPSNDFFWVDGEAVGDKNFTHMSSEDSDNALAQTDQQCVFLQVLESKSSWVPVDCTEPKHYACEVPAGEPVTLIPPSNDRYCPEGWEQNGDYCYLFSAEEKTWTKARTYCTNRQADLVSISTWGEQDFVKNHQPGRSWIGLNDRQEEDTWIWSDGKAITVLNWNDGEPNNGGGENCAEMREDDLGKWNDLPCDDFRKFTCKQKASSFPIGVISTTSTVPPDYTICGEGWTENPETGECYRLELEELNFANAREYCQEHSHGEGQDAPDIVSIYSAQEQTFVYNLLSSQHLSQSSVWIGFKNDQDGVTWTDNTPVAFFNWYDGEPNGYGTESCTEMYTGTGLWNDQYCGERRAFICEKKGSSYVGPQLPLPPDAKCPTGMSYFDNHCYYFSTDTVDWDTANAACSADDMGSVLTSVASIDENDFLVQKALAMSSYYNLWLGLHDDNNGDNWHWIDGSPYTFTNWGAEEPNNQNDEHCGEMRLGDYLYEEGQWNDMPCSSFNYYVCKQSVRTCPEGWQYESGKCYYVSDYEATWHEAQGKCKLIHPKADLVSLHSDEENELFRSLQNQASQSTWIGLTYLSNISDWVWTDGLDTDYLNWNEGEPNNLETETCAEMIDWEGENDGKWNNLACINSRSFGCEFFPTHTLGCGDNWEPFGDYCYWWSNTDDSSIMVNYDDARARCLDEGGDLASVHTAEEYDFVYAMMVNTNSYTDTWIGLHDKSGSGSLEWTDGTDVTYTNFDTLGPYEMSYSSVCASLYLDYFFDVTVWGFDDCTATGYYICKKAQHSIPINPATPDCQEDDQPYKGSCYRLVETGLSWSAAKSDCETRDSHLVVVNDRYESAYISAFLGEVEEKAWIGMSGNIEGDGSVTFSWVNGDDVDFTNWDEYEPAPEHGTCVAASGEKTNPGLWSVRNCEDNFKYVCEYTRTGFTTPAPITTKPPEYYCLAGWKHTGGRCYKVHNTLSSWGEAEQFCASFGGHLASIESEGEENIIMGLPGVSSAGKLWVGLSMGSESGYEWSDGTAFSYVNWDVDQPDTNGDRETCIGADASSLKLSNYHCDAHLRFLCEAREGVMVTTPSPPTKPPTQKCSDDETWFLYDNYCYRFVTEADQTPHSWWESHRLCREDGGELASIHTPEENYWIESMIYELTDKSLWIGAQAKFDSGYQWIDTTPFDYENWADGEPNSMQGQEDCVSLYTRQQGYWNDMNCGEAMGRICKRQHGVTHPPAQTTTPPPGDCPEGWLHAGTKCLQYVAEWVTFDTARKDCQASHKGADLASIHSAAEEAYLMSVLGLVNMDLWIGLRYTSGFHWVDQTPVHYTNWDRYEPSGTANSGEKEDCVIAFANSGKWNDVTCYSTYRYICMMNQDPSIETHHPPTLCPEPFDDYVLYNGACYLHVTAPSTWQEAENTCNEDGAHLASILSFVEDSFVWVTAQESHVPEVWTGLNDMQNKDLFQWVDDWPTVYTNWGLDQPTLNTTNPSCITVNTADGLWYAQACDQLKPGFVCKYTNQSAITPDPPTNGHCPDSRWMDLGGAYCYLVSETRTDWSGANMNCLQESSNLASIHSEEESQLIVMATNSVPGPIWIGLVQKTSGYGWSDGTGFNFVNWDTNEPNDEYEQCVEQNPTSGKWNDAYCSNNNYFLCKVKKEPDELTDPPIIHPPTNGPGAGGGGSDSLSGGAIAGIVIAVLILVAGIGFIGYSHVHKQPIKTTDSGPHGYANISYNGAGGTTTPGGKKNINSIYMDSVAVGSHA